MRERVKQLDRRYQLVLMRRMQALAARPDIKLSRIVFDINALANALLKGKEGTAFPPRIDAPQGRLSGYYSPEQLEWIYKAKAKDIKASGD